MRVQSQRGALYRCPVCGAEVAVLSGHTGEFSPSCCNRPMVRLARGLQFYVCPVCGAELAVLKPSTGRFTPRCCNRDMVRAAA